MCMQKDQHAAMPQLSWWSRIVRMEFAFPLVVTGHIVILVTYYDSIVPEVLVSEVVRPMQYVATWMSPRC